MKKKLRLYVQCQRTDHHESLWHHGPFASEDEAAAYARGCMTTGNVSAYITVREQLLR